LDRIISIAPVLATFESFPSLLPTKKRPAIYQQWILDGSLEMQVPLTARSNKSRSSLDTSHRLLYLIPTTTSILGLPKRAAEKYLGAYITGWRFGVLHFALWASVVFLINFIAKITGLAATISTKGVFYDGDCDRVKNLNTGLHLGINILSTILLAGINYTMQCLSAPT
jgi:hypothetical protein